MAKSINCIAAISLVDTVNKIFTVIDATSKKVIFTNDKSVK